MSTHGLFFNELALQKIQLYLFVLVQNGALLSSHRKVTCHIAEILLTRC